MLVGGSMYNEGNIFSRMTLLAHNNPQFDLEEHDL